MSTCDPCRVADAIASISMIGVARTKPTRSALARRRRA
jgi:hypothetical protein